MRRDTPKNVEWLGSTLRTITGFPKEVQNDLGFALYQVQIGERPSICKTYQGAIQELRENDPQNRTYRLVYLAALEEAVYVLHVFVKKSTGGIATPQADLIAERFKEAQERHEAFLAERKKQ